VADVAKDLISGKNLKDASSDRFITAFENFE